MRYSGLPRKSNSFGKTALLTGLPFGVAMGSLWVLCFSLLPAWLFGSTLLSPVFGVGLGVLCGVLFGVSIATFVGRREEEFAPRNPCAPGETLLESGAANHFLRGEAVGGYLWLTDERLHFESHAYNLRTTR